MMPVIFGFTGYFAGKYIHFQISHLSQLLTEENQRSSRTHDFVEKLIKDEAFSDVLLVDDNDTLSKSLINLRDTLRKNKDEAQQRKKEDDQRNWISEGLAKFGDILRNNNNKIKELTETLIQNLVKYINANQGAIYILNDTDPDNQFFEMTACYAYDKKKFADKRIEWNDGLIGACALEKDIIVLTDIPDSYLEITSGLGKANPRCLILVPLLNNEDLHGVIEIASFSEFQNYEINFLKTLTENIASTLSSVKINIRTAQLLKESQEQALILAAQEEQMRQNMEELKSIQEEAARQAEKFISFTNSVNHTLIRAEYDPDGTLIYANTKFINKLGYNGNAEVEGKHISMFVNKKDRDWFEPLWEELSHGGRHFEGDIKHVTKQGNDLWTMATYTCVRKDDGNVDKILFLAMDTTEQKILSLDFQGQVNALNHSSIKAEFNTSGKFIDSNELYHQELGYTEAELKEKTIFDLVYKDDIDYFRNLWKDVISDIPRTDQIRKVCKNNVVVYLRGTFSGVKNMYGELEKVILVANNITKEKEMETETEKQTFQLKLQEEKLRMITRELAKQLEEAKDEMKFQFREIERIKIRNERTLEGALDAIITINKVGNIEFFNHAAELLWDITKKEAIGQPIKILFPDQTLQNNDFIRTFINSDEPKIIGERKEVKIKNKSGAEFNVLILLSEAKVEQEITYTAFIQRIEIELF